MDTTYTWTFEQSFLVFILIIFVTQTLSSCLKSYIPMPLLMGIVFILGFGLNRLPLDMILSSNMIAVGTIAFQMLVIHSGTMIRVGMLKMQKKGVFLCLIAAGILFLVTCFGLRPIIGKELSLLAPGSIIGGGASCAIASRWVVESAPKVAVFPWLIFMFQGLFSVPLCCWALKREAGVILEGFRQGVLTFQERPAEEQKGLVKKIPKCYKTTAYYLGSVMLVSFVNKMAVLWMNEQFGWNLNLNVTALLLGFILGNIGWMDHAPLFRSDSYGLLLLGLMGLMANTLANAIRNGSVMAIVSLLPPLILCMAVGTAVLAITGAFVGKKLGMSPYRGIIISVNCMTGFPVNQILLDRFLAMGETLPEQTLLKGQLGSALGIGTILISNGISIVIVSILVNYIC